MRRPPRQRSLDCQGFVTLVVSCRAIALGRARVRAELVVHGLVEAEVEAVAAEVAVISCPVLAPTADGTCATRSRG